MLLLLKIFNKGLLNEKIFTIITSYPNRIYLYRL